MNRENYQ